MHPLLLPQLLSCFSWFQPFRIQILMITYIDNNICKCWSQTIQLRTKNTQFRNTQINKATNHQLYQSLYKNERISVIKLTKKRVHQMQPSENHYLPRKRQTFWTGVATIAITEPPKTLTLWPKITVTGCYAKPWFSI